MDQLLANPYLAVFFFTIAGILVEAVQVYVFFKLSHLRLVHELQHENPAVGWVVAGLLISQGIIIHSAMVHNDVLVRAVIFSLFGAVMNIVAYHAFDWVFDRLVPGWSMDKAIQEHFLPGAIMAFGAFVSMGLIIAGALA